MTTYCDECEISLACVGSLFAPYLHQCTQCGYCFAQINGRTILREPNKCRLPVSKKTSWCNACGRTLRPEWYDKEGNAKNDIGVGIKAPGIKERP